MCMNTITSWCDTTLVTEFGEKIVSRSRNFRVSVTKGSWSGLKNKKRVVNYVQTT